MPTKDKSGLLQRLSVRTAILAAFGVILLTVGLAFAIVWTQGRTLESNYLVLQQESLPTLDALHSLNTTAQVLVQAASYAAMVDLSETLTHDASHHGSSGKAAVLHEQVTHAHSELLGAQADMARALAKFDAIDDSDGPFADPAFRKRLRHFAADILEDSTEFREGRIAVTQTAVATFTSHLHEDAAELRHIIGQAVEAEKEEIVEGEAIVAGAIDHATSAAAIGAVLALVIGIGAAVLISRGIAAPIGLLRDSTRRVGRGDLNIDLKASGPAELRELADSFGEMTRQLAASQDLLRRKERLASLGRIAATVSHELRNPLGVVRASIYTIKEQTAGKGLSLERTIERMERSIDRCVGIIGDLLDFARIKDLAREPTVVDAWLGEFLAEQELPSGVTLRLQLSSGARISFDRERMERAIANLVVNAAQALTDPQWVRPEDKPMEIVVTTRINGPFVEIRVADSGPGIGMDVLPKIFDALFTTKNFGVGLGLPLVRQILRQHRGSVAVEASSSGGAAFILRLPMQLAEDIASGKAA
jgi:signal transduction histidine kinase